MRRRKYRQTTILTVGSIAFLAGLVLGRKVEPLPLVYLLPMLMLGAASLRRRGIVLLLSVVLCASTLGIRRGHSFVQLLQPYQELAYQKVVVQGTASTDGAYVQNGQLGFDMSNIQFLEPHVIAPPGTIKISGFGIPAIYKGDRLQVSGKLYPTRGSRQASIGYAEMAVLGHHDSLVDRFRRRFAAGMQSALPEPLASFALGLLIGQRSTLPPQVTAELSAVGLTHVIAVSGYNLTIIIDAARRIMGKRSKYQTLISSFALIVAFLLVTGFSASIVRAAIVSMLSLWAWYYGRKIKPLLLIAMAAALTAGWYPVYIWSDVGWYLSFLAFYGVIVLAPLVIKRLYVHDKQPKVIMATLIESMCAQAMTIPVILYIFGQTSPIALLSNTLVVPFVPLAMLLSLGAGLAGMTVPVFAGLLALPARLLMTYMLDVVALLARVPHAVIESNATVAQMILMYAFIALVCLILWRRTKAKHGTITDVKTTMNTGEPSVRT